MCFPCVFHVFQELEASENETQVFLPGGSPAVPDVAHQLPNVLAIESPMSLVKWYYDIMMYYVVGFQIQKSEEL